MLEKATVTMPYRELQELIDENKNLKDKLSEFKSMKTMSDEDFENDPFKQGLDKIFNLLEKASEKIDTHEKQYFIYKAMEQYCNTFDIPINEILEDVSIGVVPNN